MARRTLCVAAVLAAVLTGSGATAQPSHYWTPVGSGWKLTFDDEFNGDALDTARWGVPDGSPDQTYQTYSDAVFAASNIRVGQGFAALFVTKSAASYRTAAMTSYFRQSGGYWEARVRPPCNAHGLAAGFWTDAAGWVFPEIDTFEWIGVTPATNYMTWHYASPQDGTNAVGVENTLTATSDLCNAFHVLGMWWRLGAITWYLDGVQVAAATKNVNLQNAAPQQTILDATVGGFGINFVDQTTRFPAHFLVDYVHVYSNAAGAVAVIPDPGYGGPGDAIGSGD